MSSSKNDKAFRVVLTPEQIKLVKERFNAKQTESAIKSAIVLGAGLWLLGAIFSDEEKPIIQKKRNKK